MYAPLDLGNVEEYGDPWEGREEEGAEDGIEEERDHEREDSDPQKDREGNTYRHTAMRGEKWRYRRKSRGASALLLSCGVVNVDEMALWVLKALPPDVYSRL